MYEMEEMSTVAIKGKEMRCLQQFQFPVGSFTGL